MADLPERVRARCRDLAYSSETARSYARWIRRLCEHRGPAGGDPLARESVVAFLDHLERARGVGPETWNQALAAITFCFRHVRGERPRWLTRRGRWRDRASQVAVPSRTDVDRVLALLRSQAGLVCALLDATGMRLAEALRLRFADADPETPHLPARDRHGHRERAVGMPRTLAARLRRQREYVAERHRRDLGHGAGFVPDPPPETGSPRAVGRDLRWQYLFPADRLRIDPAHARLCRHHLSEPTVQRAVREASEIAGIRPPLQCQHLRHGHTARLLLAGVDPETIGHILGHRDRRTTKAYLAAIRRAFGDPDAAPDERVEEATVRYVA